MAKKIRIDELLLKRKLANSIEEAQKMVYAGEVQSTSAVFVTPSECVREEITLRIKEKKAYVSRAALKLKQIYDSQDLDFEDKVCIDVGASTGGFTHFMLAQKALRVYAIDTGTNQLDYSLRINPDVIALENTSFRDVERLELIREKADVITCDISFSSCIDIFTFSNRFMKDNGKLIVLIKPQFEVEKKIADKFKGVIIDQEIHDSVIEKVKMKGLKERYSNIYLEAVSYTHLVVNIFLKPTTIVL